MFINAYILFCAGFALAVLFAYLFLKRGQRTSALTIIPRYTFWFDTSLWLRLPDDVANRCFGNILNRQREVFAVRSDHAVAIDSFGVAWITRLTVDVAYNLRDIQFHEVKLWVPISGIREAQGARALVWEQMTLETYPAFLSGVQPDSPLRVAWTRIENRYRRFREAQQYDNVDGLFALNWVYSKERRRLATV